VLEEKHFDDLDLWQHLRAFCGCYLAALCVLIAKNLF
jgi:hypothetical protein